MVSNWLRVPQLLAGDSNDPDLRRIGGLGPGDEEATSLPYQAWESTGAGTAGTRNDERRLHLAVRIDLACTNLGAFVWNIFQPRNDRASISRKRNIDASRWIAGIDSRRRG